MIRSMKPAKSMTIRLSADQAEALETVASVEELAISEVIRAAITKHIESKKQDPSFQDGLRQRLDRAQQMLRR